MHMIKTAIAGTVLAATVLASASPAEARDRYNYRHRGGDTGAAIVAGVAGIAIGAAIASSSRDRGYDGYNGGGYYNGGYYDNRSYRGGYYPQSYPYQYQYQSYPAYPVVYYPAYYAYSDGGYYNGYRYYGGYFYDQRGYRSYDRSSWGRTYGRDPRRRHR